MTTWPSVDARGVCWGGLFYLFVFFYTEGVWRPLQQLTHTGVMQSLQYMVQPPLQVTWRSLEIRGVITWFGRVKKVKYKGVACIWDFKFEYEFAFFVHHLVNAPDKPADIHPEIIE